MDQIYKATVKLYVNNTGKPISKIMAHDLKAIEDATLISYFTFYNNTAIIITERDGLDELIFDGMLDKFRYAVGDEMYILLLKSQLNVVRNNILYDTNFNILNNKMLMIPILNYKFLVNIIVINVTDTTRIEDLHNSQIDKHVKRDDSIPAIISANDVMQTHVRNNIYNPEIEKLPEYKVNRIIYNIINAECKSLFNQPLKHIRLYMDFNKALSIITKRFDINDYLFIFTPNYEAISSVMLGNIKENDKNNNRTMLIENTTRDHKNLGKYVLYRIGFDTIKRYKKEVFKVRPKHTKSTRNKYKELCKTLMADKNICGFHDQMPIEKTLYFHYIIRIAGKDVRKLYYGSIPVTYKTACCILLYDDFIKFDKANVNVILDRLYTEFCINYRGHKGDQSTYYNNVKRRFIHDKINAMYGENAAYEIKYDKINSALDIKGYVDEQLARFNIHNTDNNCDNMSNQHNQAVKNMCSDELKHELYDGVKQRIKDNMQNSISSIGDNMKHIEIDNYQEKAKLKSPISQDSNILHIIKNSKITIPSDTHIDHQVPIETMKDELAHYIVDNFSMEYNQQELSGIIKFLLSRQDDTFYKLFHIIKP